MELIYFMVNNPRVKNDVNRETRDDPNLPTKTQQVTISTLIFMLENKTKPGNEIKSHLNESLDFSLST